MEKCSQRQKSHPSPTIVKKESTFKIMSFSIINSPNLAKPVP